MTRVISVFGNLDPVRRGVVLIAAIATIALVATIARQATEPSLDLLYSGLEPAAAGDVVATLEQMGVAYAVRGNSILVDANQRDRIRLELAASGLPSTGTTGYEILDGLSGFGTTAQMFDVAHKRAVEGELSRTLLSMPAIRSARVHIAKNERRPFTRTGDTSASVTIDTNGTSLGAGGARAIRTLVASAVPGLSADRVAVVDTVLGLLSDGQENRIAEGGDGHASRLRLAVERLLEARVGPGKAIVEVHVETETDREAIVERIIDPDSRVAISTITEENNTSAQDQRDGAVTVASNVPDGDAGGSGATSSSTDSTTREQVNYEVSETQREVTRNPGAIRRITVAVLVDGLTEIGPNGEGQWTPRAPEEVSALRGLVASAVGFNEARGDLITIETLRFPAPVALSDGPVTEVPLLTRLGLDPMRLMQLGVLAVVTLILGLFVVRPILTTSAPPTTSTELARLDPPPSMAGDSIDHDVSLVSPVDVTEAAVSDVLPIATPSQLPALPTGASDATERLRQIAQDKQSETAIVLKGWMAGSEATG